MSGVSPAPHTFRRALASTAIVLLSILSFTTSGAQEDVDQLDALKAEREQIQAAAAAAALDINAATASFDEVAAALDAINGLVDLHSARLADAEQAVATADSLVRIAEAREAEIASEVDAIGVNISDLALTSFTGENGASGDGFLAWLLSDDPSETARRQSLLEFQTGSLADGLDRMRALRAEAEAVSDQRRAAAETAALGRAEADVRLRELDEAKEAQMLLSTVAATRLEARLAEADHIAERDAQKAAEIQRQEEVIADRIRLEAIARSPRPDVPLPSEIINVQGINVHESIAIDLDRLLSAARADGINLGGWGYRSSDKQVDLRRRHCGSSDYEIWDMPAFACSPPTARPGRSMHERGLAVDFTYNGASMTMQSNPGFQWLDAHAREYGFVNLPSEPWHWSNSG